MRKGYICAILVILLVGGCSKEQAADQKEHFYTETTVEGVPYIHNIKPLWGDEKRIELAVCRT